MVYAYSGMESDRHNVLSFQAIFCSFAALLTLKIKIWKKCKTKHPKILSFHTCVPLIKTTWCMISEIRSATDRIFLSSWTSFCPFNPLTAQKMKISKKWQKRLEISSFYTCVPKIMTICYTVSEIWCMTDVIVIFHFGLFFTFLPL